MTMTKEELREYLNKDIENLRALNFSETYIKSVAENLSKWAGTGLLRGLSDTHVGRSVAFLMENQRLFNEQVGAEADAVQWKRMSIPAIRRVFAETFLPYQIVSVQPMKTMQENAYFVNAEGSTKAIMMEAHSRNLRVNFDGFPEFTNLDAEAQLVANLSKEINLDMSREVIRDLSQNAGKASQVEYKDAENLCAMIEGMSAYIGAKCYNRDANWIVTSTRIVDLLEDQIEVGDYKRGPGINYVGLLNKNWRVFEDTTAPDENILIGYKGSNHFDAGYVYSPYLPINPVLEEGKWQIQSTYGKRLINPNFFGTIKVQNLPEVTPLEVESESEE